MTVTGTPLPANGEGTDDDSFPPPGPILVMPANGRYGASPAVVVGRDERPLRVDTCPWHPGFPPSAIRSLPVRCHGSGRDGRDVPTAEMHNRNQDAETVLAALRMTSRTTSGFDSMGT
jgi:hypothetical protein